MMENLIQPGRLLLKPGREKSVLNRHPWLFSGAIQRIEGHIKPGSIIEVQSAQEEFLGYGYINPKSQIICRLLAFKKEKINDEFFRQLIRHALNARFQSPLPHQTNAFRLINSEGDFLPGLIVDYYQNYLVLQILTLGMASLQPIIVDILIELLRPKGILLKGSCSYQKEEELKQDSTTIYGLAPEFDLEVEEYGIKYLVDLKGGQKTGLFLDQRDNRHLFATFTEGTKVLDCFAYSGGFTLHCCKMGASRMTIVESSKSAMESTQSNFRLNNFPLERAQFESSDVFTFLRNTKEKFDLIILDPPPFARKKTMVTQAARGYKELNRQALLKLNESGLLFTFSCSHHIDSSLFQKILFAASLESGKRVQIIEQTKNPIDHPISIYHPEGEYLKGFLLRMIGNH